MPFSMTGYGAAEGPVAGGQLRVEIRTVNHRFFNPALKVGPDLAPLEGELRERLRKEFERGHVAVTTRWVTPPTAPAGVLQLNVQRAHEALARLRELQRAVGLSGEIPLELVVRQVDVLTVRDEDTPISWAEVEPIVAEAASACRAMRRQEGTVLTGELRRRIEALDRLAGVVAARAPERLVRERDRLGASVAGLLEGRPMDEARLAQELALAADRLDITEELVRLRAHLAAAGSALQSDRAVGKELGFLAQEIGREINTIGSKANDGDIAAAVIAMKGELEKFREQVENLE
jgi:uncharacterized protein (TIGR00255 family)